MRVANRRDSGSDFNEDYINSENLILKHLSDLAKQRAAVYSQKNKNVFRFF